jgi:hypothetical protein
MMRRSLLILDGFTSRMPANFPRKGLSGGEPEVSLSYANDSNINKGFLINQLLVLDSPHLHQPYAFWVRSSLCHLREESLLGPNKRIIRSHLFV